jgi:hypothetical protein
MISHSCENVSWLPVTKKVWSSNLKKLVDHSFLRWNLSNDYNFEMNNNNIANQLRLVYCIMRFQKKQQVVVGTVSLRIRSFTGELVCCNEAIL